MISDLNNLSNIEKIARVWQLQLNLEYSNPESNTRISFKDIGAFCEMLASNYNPNFIGSGSGGMGYDLINYATKKGVEVKSCCTIQNCICKGCGTKYNKLFVSLCPKCQSSEREEIFDSRFGIDAKEFLRQYKEGHFENFTICYISLSKQDYANHLLRIKMEWFKITFDDPNILDIQLEYFNNQNDFGRKPHCNLLPYSYDFYKLCPKKIDETVLEINYADLNIFPQIIDDGFSKIIKVPIRVIPKYLQADFMSCKTYKDGFVELLDFAKNLPYKKKTLGKERGDTRKKVDKVFE